MDGLSYLSFHVSRAEEAKGGMETVGVIEAFDVGEYISFCLISGVVEEVMNALCFQSMEEAFHGRMFQAITFSAHGRNDVSNARL